MIDIVTRAKIERLLEEMRYRSDAKENDFSRGITFIKTIVAGDLESILRSADKEQP